MIKTKILVFFTLTNLLWTACSIATPPDLLTPEQATITPSSSQTTPAPETVLPVNTPTPAGTWEAIIDGRIYDESKSAGPPIAGATIIYDVVFSYFPELQQGRSNRIVTNAAGEFRLAVIVHDTDSIKVRIEAEGYQPYEESLVGGDLFGGRKLVVGLAPVE